MSDWKKLWEESRGNFIGGGLLLIVAGIITGAFGLWPSTLKAYLSMQLPAKVMGPMVVGLLLTCIVLGLKLRSANHQVRGARGQQVEGLLKIVTPALSPISGLASQSRRSRAIEASPGKPDYTAAATKSAIPKPAYVIDDKTFDPKVDRLNMRFEKKLHLLINAKSANDINGLSIRIHNGNPEYIDNLRAYIIMFRFSVKWRGGALR